MTTIEVRDMAGDVAGSAELDDTVFGIQPNVPVMHQVVTAQLAARRAGSHSTLTRAEVSGGGAKPWRQKGTGRSRQGSSRSPQWRGGGVAMGPKPRSYAQKTPKKMIRLALRSALSDRAADGKVIVVDEWRFDAPRTAEAVAALSELDLDGRVLLVLGDNDEIAWKSFRNLPWVHCLLASELNTYDVLCSDWVVFTLETLPGESVSSTSSETPVDIGKDDEEDGELDVDSDIAEPPGGAADEEEESVTSVDIVSDAAQPLGGAADDASDIGEAGAGEDEVRVAQDSTAQPPGGAATDASDIGEAGAGEGEARVAQDDTAASPLPVGLGALHLALRHPGRDEGDAIGERVAAVVAARRNGGSESAGSAHSASPTAAGLRFARFVRRIVDRHPEWYWQAEADDRPVGGLVLYRPEAMVGKDTTTGIDPVAQLGLLVVAVALALGGFLLLITRPSGNWGGVVSVLLFVAFIGCAVQAVLLGWDVLGRARASWLARRHGGAVFEGLWSEPEAMPDLFRALATELPGTLLTAYAETPQRAGEYRALGFGGGHGRVVAGVLDPSRLLPVHAPTAAGKSARPAVRNGDGDKGHGGLRLPPQKAAAVNAAAVKATKASTASGTAKSAQPTKSSSTHSRGSASRSRNAKSGRRRRH